MTPKPPAYRYELYGADTAEPPTYAVIFSCQSKARPAVQRTLIRGRDDGPAFWRRIHALAELLAVVHGLDWHVGSITFCLTVKDLERAHYRHGDDDEANAVSALRWVRDHGDKRDATWARVALHQAGIDL